jgi:hypothetical protein
VINQIIPKKVFAPIDNLILIQIILCKTPCILIIWLRDDVWYCITWMRVKVGVGAF